MIICGPLFLLFSNKQLGKITLQTKFHWYSEHFDLLSVALSPVPLSLLLFPLPGELTGYPLLVMGNLPISSAFQRIPLDTCSRPPPPPSLPLAELGPAKQFEWPSENTRPVLKKLRIFKKTGRKPPVWAEGEKTGPTKESWECAIVPEKGEGPWRHFRDYQGHGLGFNSSDRRQQKPQG